MFLILAFGFGNLAMLGWLAAAAAPLIIHLWSRNRYREAPWAAMQFLLAALRKNSRRMQLQQWLLLAIRTLIIGLVVLSVAEPYGERLLASGGTAPTHRVLVIDNSYSMGYHDREASNLANVKGAVGRLLHDARAGDSFSVIQMSGPPKIVAGPASLDHAAVASQVEAMTASCESADLAAAVGLVREALETKDATARAARREVIFFTDLQRDTWAAVRSAPPAAESSPPSIAAALQEFAKDASIHLVDVGQPEAANLAITDVHTSEPIATPGREVTIHATLHQFAMKPREKCNVELLVDDVPVAEQTVDVPAGGDATVQFNQRFRAAGDHSICVRAAADHLEIDDARWLVVRVQSEIRVLCVAGRDGAAKYLAEALNPNPADDSPIRPVIVNEADFADIGLADYDCVFLCNVSQFTASEAERLARFAASGRGIVFFLGDRADAANYNAASFSLGQSSPAGQAAPPLLPVRVGEVVQTKQFGLDPLDYRHPIVAPFRGRERAGLLTTPVSRYFRLTKNEKQTSVEIAAALHDGDPFIVTAPLGSGRIVVVATDGSLASVDEATGEPWTTWPTWPSFLPLIREVLAYAMGNTLDAQQRLVGTPLTSRRALPAGVDLATLQMKDPQGHTKSIAINATNAERGWSYDDTGQSGIYTLLGLPGGDTPKFAVNVNTAESDLRKLDASELPKEIDVRTSWQNTDQAGASASFARTSGSQLLLWIAFALLLIESLLAWSFGRGAL